MVMVRLLLELKYVGLEGVAVAPHLTNQPTNTITSDNLIETSLNNSSLQGFLFSDFRSDYLNVIYLYQQEMYPQWKITFSS